MIRAFIFTKGFSTLLKENWQGLYLQKTVGEQLHCFQCTVQVDRCNNILYILHHSLYLQ
jgi:hypothetical protein